MILTLGCGKFRFYDHPALQVGARVWKAVAGWGEASTRAARSSACVRAS